MTDPISFDPFLGWVDTTDPDNIPVDVRIIGASDLLRYENFGVGATTRINSLITDFSGLVTDIGELVTEVGELDTEMGKFAKGVIGFRALAGNTGTKTSTIVGLVIDIKPIPVVSGRWYKITWQFNCHTVSGNIPSGIGVELRAATYGSTGMSGTVIEEQTLSTSAWGHNAPTTETFTVFWKCVTTNATQRFCIGTFLDFGTNYVATNGKVVVEDMGAWQAAVDA